MKQTPVKSVHAYFQDVMRVIQQNERKEPSPTALVDYSQDDILSMIMGLFPGIVLVIDLHTSGYLYISENASEMIGYDRKEFLEGGLKRTIQQFPAHHNEIITQHIFPTMFGYLQRHAALGDAHNLVVSYPTQLIHRDGTRRWYQHTVKVLTLDDAGQPHLLLKMLSDIEGSKKDNTMELTIVRKNSDGKTETLYQKVFFPQMLYEHLTSREYEILTLIGEGLTNAEIAERLCVSAFTVKTHRRNLLKKTQCKGTAELTKLAMLQKQLEK